MQTGRSRSWALVAAIACCTGGLTACGSEAWRREARHVPKLADGAAYDRAVRDARTRARAKDYAGAIASYQRALESNPGDAQVLYFLAVTAMKAGDSSGALAWLDKLVSAESDIVPAPDDFAALDTDPLFRTATARLAANAARHRRATEAFRIDEPGLLAEGIAYDPVGKAFYVGSATRRKITKLVAGPRGMTATPFGGPPALQAIGGLRVDAQRRRLWAVSGADPRMDGYVKDDPARDGLVEFDLDSGAVVGTYRLTEDGHGLNDVAVDAHGRPYTTDSVGGQIYTVLDGALVPLFEATPLHRPNGIAFDDTGKILFVADTTGIYRVDPIARIAVRLPQPRGSSLGILDGLYFVNAGGPRLVGIQAITGRGRVLSATLTSSYDAIPFVETLESAHPLFDAPTTGALVGSQLYLIANSQLWFPRPPAPTILLEMSVE